MTITVKLDTELEAKLRARLAEKKITLSEYIRGAIVERMAHEDSAPTPFELWETHFSGWGSGEIDRSERIGRTMRETLIAKHRAR